MTTKQMAIEAIAKLPEDASIEDAMESLLLLAKIDRGIRQADAGKTVTHARVKARMRKWLE